MGQVDKKPCQAACRRIAAITALAAALPLAPAFADGGQTSTGNSFSGVFADIMSTVNDGILLPIGYGLLGLVAAIAFVMLAKEVLGMIMNGEKLERTRKISNALTVLGICLVAAFLPMIINGVGSMVGAGASLGTIAQ